MDPARTARTWGALAALGCVLAGALPAKAQGAEDLERARSMFSEGLSQEAAGDWAGALEKMEKVGRVKLTPQVRYHVARCKEHLGRHTEALGDYRLAEHEAQEVGAPELGEITRAREDLEGRVPKVLVTLPPSAAGARVTLDGVELGPSQLGIEILVNPGRHRLVAKLGDREWHKRFKAREGHSSEVDLTPPRADEGAASESDTERDRAEQTENQGSSSLPWVAAGVGVTGFICAGVFYALYNGAENDLNTTCRGTVCPSSAKDLQDKSDRYRIMSGISLGVGVVGGGTAAVLWLTQGGAPSKEKSSARIGVGAEVSAAWRAIRVRGTF